MSTTKPEKVLDIYDFYDTMERHNILLSFKGIVTSELLDSILSIMESKLDTADEAPKVKRKVFNVLVECLQNLYHHNEGHPETEEDEINGKFREAIFMIGKLDGVYSIITGNYVTPAQMEPIKAKIDMVNGMTREELKAQYQIILNNGQRSSKGTAGLGMLDIARKSGQKLGYDFLKVSDDKVFFSLNVKIAQKK